jgi:hypothetical protein
MIRFVQVLQATKGWAAPEAADAAAHAQTLAETTNNLALLVVHMAGLFAAALTGADYLTTSAVADRVLHLANREGTSASLGTAHVVDGTQAASISSIEKRASRTARLSSLVAAIVPA